jgi:hypothetical protein
MGLLARVRDEGDADLDLESASSEKRVGNTQAKDALFGYVSCSLNVTRLMKWLSSSAPPTKI